MADKDSNGKQYPSWKWLVGILIVMLAFSASSWMAKIERAIEERPTHKEMTAKFEALNRSLQGIEPQTDQLRETNEADHGDIADI